VALNIDQLLKLVKLAVHLQHGHILTVPIYGTNDTLAQCLIRTCCQHEVVQWKCARIVWAPHQRPALLLLSTNCLTLPTPLCAARQLCRASEQLADGFTHLVARGTNSPLIST
jgi:hypothetical protein